MCKTDIDSEAVMGALKAGNFDIGENPYGVMTSIKDYTNSIFEAINELQESWKSAVADVGDYIDVFQGVPEPEEGENLATMSMDITEGTGGKLQGVTSSLRVRNNAGTENGVVGLLTPGTAFTVLGTSEDSSGKTWYHVKYKDENGKEVEGYAAGNYIKVDETTLDTTAPTPSDAGSNGSTGGTGATGSTPSGGSSSSTGNPTGGTKEKPNKTMGTVDNINDSNTHLNIRSTADASNNSNVVGQLSKGDKIEILGEEKGFYKIKTSSGIGYVSKNYVSLPKNSRVPNTILEIPSKTTVNLKNTNGHLNFRSVPNGSGSNNIIGSIENGTELDVVDRSGDWTKVKYNGQEGWVYTKYLTK